MARQNTTSKVLKVMSIFTGVEGVGILCSMVKNKLVAIWLSAVGTGLFAIFNQTIDTATYLTSLGLRQSSVRDLAIASRDESKLQRMVRNVRSWSVLVGLVGALLLSALAWPLAEVILGDGRQWWNFIILGGVMLFNALYAGENAIFQGTENYRRLARTGLETSVIGLLVSIPMYRFLGDNSVIYSILAYAVLGVVFVFVNRDRRFPVYKPSVRYLSDGKGFVKLGAWLSIAGFINTACQLVFISWLNVNVSTAEVGLYGAGMSLVVRYTSLVFNSVGMEFYPRISADAHRPRRVGTYVNHEVSLLLLIFTPLVLLFLIFVPWIVRILYAEEYLAIVPFVSIGMLTVLFRSVSTVMAYTTVAKGEGKIYLLTEATDALLGLGLCILFYNWMGLLGVGVALVVWHFIYMCVVWSVYHYRYHYRVGTATLNLLIFSTIICSLGLASLYLLPSGIGAVLMLCAAIYYIRLFIKMLRKHRSRKKLSAPDKK